MPLHGKVALKIAKKKTKINQLLHALSTNTRRLGPPIKPNQSFKAAGVILIGAQLKLILENPDSLPVVRQ